MYELGSEVVRSGAIEVSFSKPEVSPIPVDCLDWEV